MPNEQSKGPGIPGAPSSRSPSLAEPTEPREPLKKKPDQGLVEAVSPTGIATGPKDARIQSGSYLTTAQGLRVADTDHSLKAGARGPTLLQDHHLREKIMHFDHERIPERVVHARGAAAHGTFQSYGTASEVTCARFLAPDVETPVFVRFSTVVGSRGSADVVRDTRGFATKFYTQEGVYDLVGNNIPVFFIQDAIKFPDIVHAAKPHPDREIPQAQSAHDTFWDFVSLHTEAQAHAMWQMSDRAIPRSYRMMEGFGIHTFRLVREDGRTVLAKFHWKPRAGVHSVVWDEAVMINGADPDFHRRDLYDAIEAGAFPQWELGIQVFPDNEDQVFEGIDLLDPTKFVPEELAAVQPVGLLTLTANPTNFFAEVEQVAFHPGHLVRGIDVTDDPLLQGRLFSYLDTQITRLGGSNFSQIPINRPHAPINDMLRDGLHQDADQVGVAPYRPNSLDGGCPFVAGPEAYVEVPQPAPTDSRRVRESPATFADHFSQARLFWLSMTPIEREHIVAAYSFELGKCYESAIKQRQVQCLANIDPELCAAVAQRLGLQAPEPNTEITAPHPSAALSQLGHEWPTDGRVIGIVADADSDLAAIENACQTVLDGGMVPLVIAPHGGELQNSSGGSVTAQRTFHTARSVEYDAVVLAGAPAPAPDAALDVSTGGIDPRIVRLVAEAYRHAKPIGGWAGVADVLEAAGCSADVGVVVSDDPQRVITWVSELLRAHRTWSRFTGTEDFDG